MKIHGEEPRRRWQKLTANKRDRRPPKSSVYKVGERERERGREKNTHWCKKGSRRRWLGLRRMGCTLSWRQVLLFDNRSTCVCVWGGGCVCACVCVRVHRHSAYSKNMSPSVTSIIRPDSFSIHFTTPFVTTLTKKQKQVFWLGVLVWNGENVVYEECTIVYVYFHRPTLK